MPQTITTPAGSFTAEVAGPADGPLVVLLHGFPQTRHSWRHQVPALAAAGYRAVAPDQRGYSPGVRPDPAVDLAAYGIDRLVSDVFDLAAALGCSPPTPFHLVGHDWGGQVAWAMADRHPERIASLMELSRPRPSAFWRALEAALAWYRAAGSLDAVSVGPIAVPTVYLWGDADATVGRAAAGWTAEFVIGDYRFEVLPGVGHFITDQVPEVVTTHLLEQLARTSTRR